MEVESTREYHRELLNWVENGILEVQCGLDHCQLTLKIAGTLRAMKDKISTSISNGQSSETLLCSTDGPIDRHSCRDRMKDDTIQVKNWAPPYCDAGSNQHASMLIMTVLLSQISVVDISSASWKQKLMLAHDHVTHSIQWWNHKRN